MKLAWNIIAFVAIVNLLAVIFFGGWLTATGRVNQDRIETVQTLFALPADIESEEVARLRIAEDIEALKFEEEASLSRQPMGSDAQIAAVEDLVRREQLLLRRIERENAEDRRALETLERQLTEREIELEKRIADFAASRKKVLEESGEASFIAVVKLMETLPSRQAKDQILLLVANGEKAEAVRCLRAMRAGPRTQIIASMKTESEQKVASDLLESLRIPPFADGVVMETIDAGPAAPN
ncbi:MAG: hypothetical protein P8J45_11800 [Phycisphaerales bacterium]|nr:hypothetical protein [Phycisphaerales bacterium]